MAPGPRLTRLPFLLVVGVCALQIAWWVYFQYGESSLIERNELARLEALCYRALVSIAPAVKDAQRPRELLARELARREEFRELEFATEPGEEVRGARLDTVLFGVGPELARSFIRPSYATLRRVREKTRRTRLMFMAEGITFTALMLCGVVLLYTAVRRERKMRRQHESFLAGATHELKTPLATLRLGLQTLERKIEDRTKARSLHQLVGQVDRLRMQIDNLLRTAAGRGHTFNLLPGDVRRDLEEVALEFAPRFESRRIELKVEPRDATACVSRDKEALQQVFRNLLDNALKYTPEGGSIRVSLRTTNGTAQLLFEDHGPGIPAAERTAIFNQFFRGSSQPTSAQGGTGLGLWVSQQTIEALGGRLELLESAGEGAAFAITLPIAPDHENGSRFA